jgi:hypothetical protein
MKEAPSSSKTSVLTRAPLPNIPEDAILQFKYLSKIKLRAPGYIPLEALSYKPKVTGSRPEEINVLYQFTS